MQPGHIKSSLCPTKCSSMCHHKLQQHVSPLNCSSVCHHQIAAACVTKLQQHVSPPNCSSMCHQIAAACVTKLQHASPHCSSMCHQIAACVTTKLQQNVSPNCISVCHQIAAACVTKLQQRVSPNCSSVCHQIAACVTTKLQQHVSLNCSIVCHHQNPPPLVTYLAVCCPLQRCLLESSIVLSPGRNRRETGSDIILRCQSNPPTLVIDTRAGRKLLGAQESAARWAKRPANEAPRMQSHDCIDVALLISALCPASHCIRHPNTVHLRTFLCFFF
ncbi:hypothetical protein AB205_0039800 [Aquarana catesbeiana]|uniref:Uncharacterized protein n=1 Tax=Aquarana catesbeiana TaxID=8400 RepID=A0A2G9Q6V1_AQUCT|nr:hypothetical protein AB205_0039800 [Aquarana catesbeiana]